jgi:hypothetical protein
VFQSYILYLLIGGTVRALTLTLSESKFSPLIVDVSPCKRLRYYIGWPESY